MNISSAKNINIAGYLQSTGYTPCKRQGNNLWYFSPFRKETEPSFKINLSRNEWYDFGIGKGGDIIKLVMELYKTDDVSKALQILSGSHPSIEPSPFSFRQPNDLPGFEDIRILPLTNASLLYYLKERNIHLPFAQEVCKEVHFKANGKPYFAIGFENDNGGYELRNKYFQGAIAPKTITTLKSGNNSCCIFEGFIDYLSYLTIKQKDSSPILHTGKQDYIILNSITSLSNAMGIIRSYGEKYCYLDNDTAGKSAFVEIQRNGGQDVFSRSMYYVGYKDLNDYLCGKRQQHNKGMRL